MELRGINTLHGPSLFHCRPVIVARLFLDDLKNTRENERFLKAILELLPGLARHECVEGKTRLFSDRFLEGTNYGHVVEHVAIELAAQAHCPVHFARTIYSEAQSSCEIILEFSSEKPTCYLLTIAVEIVRSLLHDDTFLIEPVLFRARELAAAHEPREGTRAIMRAAAAAGIPVRRLPETDLLQLGQGIHRKLLLDGEFSLFESPALHIIQDRILLRKLLQFAGIPIPSGLVVESEEAAEEAFLSLNGVVEIKPGSRKGLTWIGRSAEGVKNAFKEVRKTSLSVIIEEHLDMPAYEVIVINGRIISVIAASGEAGSRIDLERIHPRIHSLCRRTSEAIGLQACRITLMTPDISYVYSDASAVVVGVYTLSTIISSLARDQTEQIAREIVNLLFPPGSHSRIPLVSVSGTNGKTTTVQLISHILSSTGTKAGCLITDGIAVDGESIQIADPDDSSSVWALLFGAAAEAGVVEVSDTAASNGLGYENSDLAVFLNLDHDNAPPGDRLAAVSLIAERVREGGTIVLNAEDSLLAGLADRESVRSTDREIVFFASTLRNIRLKSHILAGGRGYYIKTGCIVEAGGGDEETICDLKTLNFTMGGTIAFQVQDLLAAIAALRRLGVRTPDIQRGLQSFDAAARSGRIEVFRAPGGTHVILDRAATPGAIAAVGSMSRAWGGEHQSTVVLRAHSSAPDTEIRRAGAEAARHFDRLILTEEKEKSGRGPGETAQLLLQGALSERKNISYQIVLNEREAQEGGLDQVEPEGFLFMFTDNPAVARLVIIGKNFERVDEIRKGPFQDIFPARTGEESPAFPGST